MNSISRVGILLTSPSRDLQTEYITPFEDALTRLMKARGDSVEFVRAYPNHYLTDEGELNTHAESLVACQPDAIWVISTASAEAVLSATNTIPVIGSAVNLDNSETVTKRADAGNFAGVRSRGPELGRERLQRLHEIYQHSRKELRKVGVLVKTDHQGSRSEFEQVIAPEAKKLGVEIARIDVQNTDELQSELEKLRQSGVTAVLTTHAPFFQNHRAQILQFCTEHDIPVVGHRTFFVEDGALLAYSTDLSEQMRRSAELVAAVLRGKGIAALDKSRRVQVPEKAELAINLDVAGRHGLDVPERLMKRADRLVFNCTRAQSSQVKP